MPSTLIYFISDPDKNKLVVDFPAPVPPINKMISFFYIRLFVSIVFFTSRSKYLILRGR